MAGQPPNRVADCRSLGERPVGALRWFWDKSGLILLGLVSTRGGFSRIRQSSSRTPRVRDASELGVRAMVEATDGSVEPRPRRTLAAVAKKAVSTAAGAIKSTPAKTAQPAVVATPAVKAAPVKAAVKAAAADPAPVKAVKAAPAKIATKAAPAKTPAAAKTPTKVPAARTTPVASVSTRMWLGALGSVSCGSAQSDAKRQESFKAPPSSTP